MRQLGPVLVGIFAWTVTALLGATLLDVVYAAERRAGGGGGAAAAGDMLLTLTAVAVVAGLAAITTSRERRSVAFMVVASLATLLFGLLTPALLGGIVASAEAALGSDVGPWVRLVEGGLASMLAFGATWESWRR